MGHWLTVQMLDLKSLPAEGHDTEQVFITFNSLISSPTKEGDGNALYFRRLF